jgi:exopolysaccharide production protein ExoZ
MTIQPSQVHANEAAARPKLVTLEAGRFFASAAVMLFHYSSVIADARGVTVFGDIFRPGHVGVPYFFVLSGFIIYHVHRSDIGRPGAVAKFAVKRAIRLYPLFLLISLAMLVGFIVAPALAGDRSLTPAGIAADLLLLPHHNAILSISWTLRHEMVFYGLFALALALGRKAFWVIALWIAFSLVGEFFLPVGKDALGSWSILASNLNLGFALGMIVAELSARPSVAPPALWIAIGGMGLAVIAALEWWFGAGVDHGVAILGPMNDVGYLFAAAILIYGLVGLEHSWRMPASTLWKILGGSSYVLYLIHQPMGSVLVRVFSRAKSVPAEALFALIAVSAVIFSLIVHLIVERWMLARLSRWYSNSGGVYPTPSPRPS